MYKYCTIKQRETEKKQNQETGKVLPLTFVEISII